MTSTEEKNKKNNSKLKIGLALSGGGYRAMLFHYGSLIRLNELGLLKKIDRISSVSGGSIIAAYLGMNWGDLSFDQNGVATNFKEVIEPGIRKLAGTTIDVPSILCGLLLPFVSTSSCIERFYRKILFLDKTIKDIADSPEFVFNATNLHTGKLFRISKKGARDWKTRNFSIDQVTLAQAVTASSAFPPFLSPFRFKGYARTTAIGNASSSKIKPEIIKLTDGGVYDNLGLERIFNHCNTILVSDAGLPFSEKKRIGINWFSQLLRIRSIHDNQVRSLRKRDLMGSFYGHVKMKSEGMDPDSWVMQNYGREGAFWDISSTLDSYQTNDTPPAPDQLAVDEAEVHFLSQVSTRLCRMEQELQDRLINWGYAACDSSVRTFYLPAAPPPRPPKLLF